MARRKTNEEFVKEVYGLVGDEYTFLEEYVNAKTKIRCRHNKCDYEWMITPNSFLNGHGCPKCAGNMKWDTNRYKKKVYKAVDNEYSVLGEYVNSQTHILMKHNICGHEYMVKPNNFITNQRRCPQCFGKFLRTDEEFKKEIYDRVGNEYSFLDKYIKNQTPLLCRHNECGYEWRIRPSNFLKGHRCPRCAGVLQRSKCDFLNEVYKLVGDEYSVIGEYVNYSTKTSMIHNLCGHRWEVVPTNFITQGTRCPVCSMKAMGLKQRSNTEEFKKRVHDLTMGEYEVLGEYVKNDVKIKIKHSICGGEYNVTPGKFLSGRRCPVCNESTGEERIRMFLQKEDIDFHSEFRFSDCKYRRPLPFDFYIDSYNLLIEYDGEGHYKPFRFSKDTKKNMKRLKKTLQNDQIKNQYCKDNNIPLLRIPYWEFDNIETILKEWLTEHGVLNQ